MNGRLHLTGFDIGTEAGVEPVGVPTTAGRRAAPPIKEPHVHPMLPAHRRQPFLGLVDGPIRPQVPTVLGAIAEAQHHVLHLPPFLDVLAVRCRSKQDPHLLRGTGEVGIAESGEALSAGDVVYVSGVSGNFPVVSKAQANSATTMPAFGLVQDAAGASGTEVRVTTFGDFTNFDTSTPGWSLGDTLYVSAATAGGLTNSAPAGEANLIQNIGKVTRCDASVGSIKIGGAGRTNATPNLNNGNVFIGNASNQAVARALVEADISDFGTYLTGNQTITLSGDVSGSGTTSIAVTVADDSHDIY